MLDNGYDLMHAMQDAMDEKKFMLVLTLLSKNPDDHVIQSKNSKGQNLPSLCWGIRVSEHHSPGILQLGDSHDCINVTHSFPHTLDAVGHTQHLGLLAAKTDLCPIPSDLISCSFPFQMPLQCEPFVLLHAFQVGLHT